MDRPVSFEEAVVLANEIGESLGGRQQEALRILVRHAMRSRRNSSATTAEQHFRNAAEIATPKKDSGA